MKATRAQMKVWMAALWALVSCAHAAADTVTLHSGTILYGEILEESPTHVTIKTKVSNVLSTLKLARTDIAAIEKTGNPVKPGFLETPATNDDKEEEAIAGDVDGVFMLIPIHGTIGKDSLAEGVKNALKAAKAARVKHVVFDIDTPGGVVAEASAIVEAIAEYRKFGATWDPPPRFYAYVRNAISAGIWVLFSCDEICWADQGTAGGAVAFRQDNSTGAAQVDAKMNSIMAAQLATAAQTLGHPGEVVRAMMVMDAELYAWKEAGEERIAGERPANIPDARQVDGPTEILTLTTSDAMEIGLGRRIPDGPQGIGPALGVPGWKQASKGGEAAMKGAARALENKSKKLERDVARAEELLTKARELNSTLPAGIDKALAADPRNGSYTTRNGLFTEESRAEWSRRTSSALKMWGEILDRMREMDRLDKEFKKLTGDSIFNRVQGRMVASEVDRIVARLKSEAGRDRP